MKSIEQIETFLVLAECGSFTETAKRLYRSQPAVTNQIQKLEEMVGASLFKRSGKAVQLTKSGEIYLAYARQMNRLMEEASEQIRKSAKQQVLSVYASIYLSNYYFADILDRFNRDNPKQVMEIYSFCYDDLKRALMEKRTDFAFMPYYSEDENIHDQFDYIELFQEQFQLILPSDHPWASRKLLLGRDLQNEKILLPSSSYFQKIVSEQMELSGVNVTFLQMSNFELIRQAVKSHLGLAFLPSSVVADEIRRGELVVRPVSGLHIRRRNGIIIRKNASLSPIETAFCTIAQNHFQSHAQPI
ncbi:LysR family transcriptional regulator [Cohnella faecalis]|uniref:LysR family transcriptional regulator n=1 Tax=Cohnella faecalis TaxID=2315694 RepID=UPI001F1EDBC4|nr:LysR family transcriptional regulator [Cohnella faecalis]